MKQEVAKATLGVVLIIGLSLLFMWKFQGREDVISVIAMAFLFASVAFAWNIHALSGVVSLGHAAFFGLGAYGSALFAYYFKVGSWIILLVGGTIALGCAVVWHLFFEQLRGGAYTLATFAAAEIVRVVVDNWDSLTMGSSGLTNIVVLFSGTSEFYLVTMVLVIIAFLIHWAALKTCWGLQLRTVREDELAAYAIGVNPPRVRMVSLFVSAFITGLCGAIFVHRVTYLEPSMVFNLHISAMPLVFSFLGGRFTTMGPLIGAFLLYSVDQILLSPFLPSTHQAVYGFAIVITVSFMPNGICAWLARIPQNASG
ncbi:MAG: branched-chain amino acid ABC transporter permease [Deltaproteobacteria bacterium]|nr:branched-chain amino acid ABC transporter permease [Deltaproteobacteria bacterium]MBW2069399.1 branched-chain amino acid ABC transporter permease [Deltaproteobacteria bacterium]